LERIARALEAGETLRLERTDDDHIEVRIDDVLFVRVHRLSLTRPETSVTDN
jgi:hypothetical protein